MILKLTAEQRDALRQQPGPVPVEDGETHEVYFLLDRTTLEALRREAFNREARQ